MARTRSSAQLALLLFACSCDHCGGGGGPDAALPDLGTDASASWDFGAVPISALAAARAAWQAGATSIDLEGNGRIHYTRSIDTDGGVTTRQSVTIDGHTALVWVFDTTPQTFQRFRISDGALELSVSVTPNATPGAFDFVVVKYSLVTTVPDVRRTFTLDPALPNVTVTVEEDAAHSGTFSSAGGFTTLFDQPAVGNLTFDGSCSAAEQSAITKAFDEATSVGAACLSDVYPELAANLATLAISTPLTIKCSPTASASDPRACASTSTVNYYGPWDPTSPVAVTIYPQVFTAGACANQGGLTGVIFHELMHPLLGHHIGDGVLPGSTPGQTDFDPLDQIWGCHRHCFRAAGPSRETCASCRGTSICDPKCASLPLGSCPPPLAYCACPDGRTQLYSSVTQCNVDCPTGLACFGFQCTARDVCMCP